MSVKNLQKILDEIDYPVMVEVVDCVWCLDGFDFNWNTDDDQDDLENGDGNTYSMEMFEGCYEYQGYTVVNGHNGGGQTITYFFNLSKEVKF